MRWLFNIPEIEKEKEAKEILLHKIKTFWQNFESNTDQIKQLFEQKRYHELDNLLSSWLEEIDEGIVWNLTQKGSLEKGSQKFVVTLTPEDRFHLRPLVETFVNSAPKIPGFEFNRFVPSRGTSFNELSDNRLGNFDTKSLSFNLVVHPQHNVIIIDFRSPHFMQTDFEEDLGLCFTITELILGEEIMEKWLGSITTSKEEVNELSQNLLEEFNSKVVTIENKLPDKPYYEEFVPTVACFQEDYQENQAPSRYYFETQLSNVMDSINNRGMFFSKRFPKFGELFCYLRFEEDSYLDSNNLERLRNFESELDRLLRENSCGCCFGLGYGPKTVFVDLVLSNVEKATVLLQTLCAEKIDTRRAWIIFHDLYLCDEWIGLHEETPPPIINDRW